MKYKVLKNISEYSLESVLNQNAEDGWVLQQAFTNEPQSRWTIIMYLDDAGLDPSDSVQKLKLI